MRLGKHSSLRNFVRKRFFQFLFKVSETDEARSLAARTLKGQLFSQPLFPFPERFNVRSPYQDLGESNNLRQQTQKKNIIIVTGRFRSGSTLLWNIFRNIQGMTAYYEPFNERRWFDAAKRGTRVDATHKRVNEYWREYDGLDELGNYYSEDWIRRNLYMDGSFWEPAMKSYIETLIAKAPGRPVLQFNRIDLRLPWLRRNFPDASVLHIYRHPRDQWCSTLLDAKCFPNDGTMEEFAPQDKFYLLMWARDLKYKFPFLDEREISHPYAMFYYIWKLSYIFGIAYADCSISLEDILADPRAQITRLLAACRVQENYDLDKLKDLIETPITGKWKSYAEERWFRHHESICEATLANFFSSMNSPSDWTGVEAAYN